MTPALSPSLALIHKVAHLFSALPQVEAVALAGSRTSTLQDARSDIDIYVYTRDDLALAEREVIVERSGGASTASLGLTFWGPGATPQNSPCAVRYPVLY
jgi:hypothetical protein